MSPSAQRIEASQESWRASLARPDEGVRAYACTNCLGRLGVIMNPCISNSFISVAWLTPLTCSGRRRSRGGRSSARRGSLSKGRTRKTGLPSVTLSRPTCMPILSLATRNSRPVPGQRFISALRPGPHSLTLPFRMASSWASAKPASRFSKPQGTPWRASAWSSPVMMRRRTSRGRY